MVWILIAAAALAFTASGSVNVALVAVLVAALYFAECSVWGSTRCTRCGGAKREMSPSGSDAWRRCPRCNGSGERRRFGRVLLDRTKK